MAKKSNIEVEVSPVLKPKAKVHESFHLCRRVVFLEHYHVEAMTMAHAKRKLRRLLKSDTPPEPFREPLQCGHIKEST